jgi:hypothetical protein
VLQDALLLSRPHEVTSTQEDHVVEEVEHVVARLVNRQQHSASAAVRQSLKRLHHMSRGEGV